MSGTEQAAASAAPAPRGGLVDRLRKRFERLVRDPNPILVKELRSTFRRKLFIRFLYLSTGIVGIVVLSGGAAVAASSLPPAEVGQIVFQIFFSTALFVICLVAPAYAATSLTSEREQRTYESLILSGMAPWRIVRGKFLAAYASMFLVLVALAPVVGIAFLFGGVSPWHVVVGYGGLMIVLAPAVSFGVAISARLKSTRIAILITTLVFVPAAFFATIFLAAIGEGAKSEWGTGMSGPFWFTEALVSRVTEWDTLATLVGLPAYLLGMPVWFFLASAVAGIRPPAEDRSTPFKVWSLVSATGLTFVVGMLVTLFGSADDAAEAGLGFVIGGGLFLLFYATLFMNEPPLPPRLADLRTRGTVWRPFFVALGPGAAPTLRYAAVLVVATSFGMAGAASLLRHLLYPGFGEHAQFDAGLLVVALGNAAVALFLASFGAWLRVNLRSGIAARVLAVAAIGALGIVPFLFSLILDPSSIDRMDDAIPFAVHFSPFQPSILGVLVADGEMGLAASLQVLLPVVFYGVGAAFFWVLVEARARRARREDDERRRVREERVRTSEPPAPLLQRASAPPGQAAAGESP